MNRILDNELLSNLDEEQQYNEEMKKEGDGGYRTLTPKYELDIDGEPGSITPQSMQRNKRVIVPLDFNVHEDLSAQFSDQAMQEFLLFQ